MPEHQQTQKSTESKSTVKKQATPRIQAPISHPMAIIQRARMNPKSLTPADILQLQRTIGNRAVGRLLSEIRSSSTAQKAPVQRQEISEEEEPLQGKMIETIQRQEIPEEEEPLQGKFENKPDIACPSCFAAPIVQRQEIPEEEEPLQGKMIGTIQRQEIPEEEEPLQTKRENNTGMPDNLKAGVENLSGIDMSDVRVHYSSDKPAKIGALAYTQGTNIHVAPGQESHLPHEAWHVVQQAQGRVQPTVQLKGLVVNDDIGLEQEADVMGAKAAVKESNNQSQNREVAKNGSQQIINEQNVFEFGEKWTERKIQNSVQSTIAKHPQNIAQFYPVFRTMRRDQGNPNQPEIGESARSLGIRRDVDLNINPQGLVMNNGKGMSTAPNNFRNLPPHRIPQRQGGTGPNDDRIWMIDSAQFLIPLECHQDSGIHATVRPNQDPNNGPVQVISYYVFKQHLDNTAPNWTDTNL